jgi:hypothetical protein
VDEGIFDMYGNFLIKCVLHMLFMFQCGERMRKHKKKLAKAFECIDYISQCFRGKCLQ